MLKPVANFAKARWENIRASYWFVPVIMISVGLAASYCCIYYGPDLVNKFKLSSYLPQIEADDASDLVSAVATAIITATSIAFSMTLVALTMASSQFGPRLLQTFMDDRGTQLVLGALTSSFIFCLCSLHRISVTDTSIVMSSILSLAVLAVGVADTFILIYYIHHIARYIQVDEIISRCYRECTAHLHSLFTLTENEKNYTSVNSDLLASGSITYDLPAKMAGYVQTIDYHAMLDNPNHFDGVEILVRSGDFVVPGQPLLTVHSSSPVNNDTIDFLASAIVTGNRRTSLQDPEFTIKQLVEVALRALSPGINDPITAMSCADRLTSVCVLMGQQPFPSPALINKQNDRWLKRRTYRFGSVLNTAFDQIRQAGETHIDVMIHLLRCLQQIRSQLAAENDNLIDKQVSAVEDLVRGTIKSEKDKTDVAAAINAAAAIN